MKIDINRIARLANLPLTSEESKTLEEQLEETLAYVKQLESVDTKDAEPTSQVTGLENVTRDDVSIESFTQDQALANAKTKHNGLFQVKGIFDNE